MSHSIFLLCLVARGQTLLIVRLTCSAGTLALGQPVPGELSVWVSREVSRAIIAPRSHWWQCQILALHHQAQGPSCNQHRTFNICKYSVFESEQVSLQVTAICDWFHTQVRYHRALQYAIQRLPDQCGKDEGFDTECQEEKDHGLSSDAQRYLF